MLTPILGVIHESEGGPTPRVYFHTHALSTHVYTHK